MPYDQLKGALEAVRNKLKSALTDSTPLGLFFPMAPQDARPVLPEVAALIRSIRETPELAESMDKILILPGASTGRDPEYLAQWLAKRSLEVGTEVAIDNIETYHSASRILVRNVLTIVGMNLRRTCRLDNEISLTPFDQLDDTVKRHAALLRSLDRMRIPTAALVMEVDLPKVFADPMKIPPDPFGGIRKDGNDIIQCAGLYGPIGPFFDESWWEIPDWVPHFGSSYVSFNAPFRPISADWPEEAHGDFPGFYHTFKQLDEPKKEHLRVPLDRLNSSMHPMSSVSAAIDCRIALESVFLSDQPGDQGELTFRLCLRAARYLAQSPEERKLIYKQVRDVYREGSIAVHTGRVRTIRADQTVDELLNSGRSIVARALMKLIAEGAQDWNMVELS